VQLAPVNGDKQEQLFPSQNICPSHEDFPKALHVLFNIVSAVIKRLIQHFLKEKYTLPFFSKYIVPTSVSVLIVLLFTL